MTTPSRKVRRAAIAAIVAVTTGMTAVTPAIAAEKAEENVVVNDANSTDNANGFMAAGLNIADGSKLPEPNANLNEKQLQEATDAIADSLNKWWKDGDFTPADFYAQYLAPNALADNEYGVLKALEAHYKVVTETLAKAAQNQANAQASVQVALNADQKAVGDWNKLVGAFKGLSGSEKSRINGLVDAVNKERSAKTPELTKLPTKTDVTPQEAIEFIRGIEKAYDALADQDRDKSEDDYASRDYAKALVALHDDKDVQNFLAPFKASQAALIDSQKSDVITRQMFLDRSRAQVQVLRLIQAQYGVAARMIQLYENDKPVNEGQLATVKKTYADLLGLYASVDEDKLAFDLQPAGARSLMSATERETGELRKADQMAKELFKGWSNDLSNVRYAVYKTDENGKVVVKKGKKVIDHWTDEEEVAYGNYRESEAKRTYNDIVRDRVWQTELEMAQIADRNVFAGKKAKDDIKAQVGKAAEEAKKANEANAKLQEDIAKATAGTDEAKNKLVAADKKIAELKEAADKSNGAIDALGKDLDASKQKISDLEKKLADATKKAEDAAKKAEDANKPQVDPKSETGKKTDEQKKSDGKDSSMDGTAGKVGIAALILAILGALAAAFPMIQKMLPPRV